MKNSAKEVVVVERKDEGMSVTEQRSVLSPVLIEAFERFVEYHPARRFSRNLRSLLLEFLMYDGSAEAEYLRDLMIDLDGLFSLLDAMEEKQNVAVSV